MKISVVDLGSNTFHMVIYDFGNCDYRTIATTNLGKFEIARKRIYVKLGKESLELAYITPQDKQRVLDAMLEFKQMLDFHQVDQVYAVATSAMRNAANAVELVDSIYQQTKIQVEVISGTQESMLIYQGVKAGVKFEDTVLIMDIGGGSVEFIVCRRHKPLWAQSFEIGAQRLLNMFHQEDPMPPYKLAELETYLKNQLFPSLYQAIAQYQPTSLVGSSGAFSALVDMHTETEDAMLIDKTAVSYVLPFESFLHIYDNVRSKGHEERMGIPGLSGQKENMIVVSTALINFILKQFAIRHITFSKYALKEGVLFNALEDLMQVS
eukprot:gene102-136_t